MGLPGKFNLRARAVTLAAILGLVAISLALIAPAAVAAPKCQTKNMRTGIEYKGASPLTDAIAAADPNDTISVFGTCTSNLTVSKNLKLKGQGNATLDGAGTGSVLRIATGTSMTLANLTITGGASLANGTFFSSPGGTVDWVAIGGTPLIPMSGGPDYVYIGTACNGDPLDADPSGKVAVITRGVCFFSDKAANAATAGAIAAVIVNQTGAGAFPQATQLANPVSIPVVGISDTAGTAMGNSGTLTWNSLRTFPQGCGSGGICSGGTLALVDSRVSGNIGTFAGGVSNGGATACGMVANVLTLAGSTTISDNRGTFSGGVLECNMVASVVAADGTSTYPDPITGTNLPAWTGSVSGNFINNCAGINIDPLICP